MKFESEFGLGEIVITKQKERGDGKIMSDLIGEIIAISFTQNAPPVYTVRLADTGYTTLFGEHELIGDSDYSQELGCYPVSN